MSKFIIIIGIMGCGKTTFAKKYAKDNNYEYINFDELYHEQFKHNQKKLFVYLKSLDKNKIYVIDNWFKWELKWYENNKDNTIKELEFLTNRKVKLILLHSDYETIKKQYAIKQDRDTGMNEIKYHETMKQRLFNILDKIKEIW